VIGHPKIAKCQPAGVEIAVGQRRQGHATGRQRPDQEQTAAGLVLSSLIWLMRMAV
jgi:hypothetical protein